MIQGNRASCLLRNMEDRLWLSDGPSLCSGFWGQQNLFPFESHLLLCLSLLSLPQPHWPPRKWKCWSLNHIRLFWDPMDSSPTGSSVHGILPGKNTGVGCYFLLQGFFLIQGSNPGLWHCRQILYCLSHREALHWPPCSSSNQHSWFLISCSIFSFSTVVKQYKIKLFITLWFIVCLWGWDVHLFCSWSTHSTDDACFLY